MVKRARVDGLLLCLGAAVFLAATGNLAFWRALVSHVPPASAGQAIFLATNAVLLVAILFLLFVLFAYRWVLKPFLIGALLIAAVCAHFMTAYGVVIDREMIRNVAETDVAEAGALLTPALALHVAIFGLLPALLVAWLELRFAPLRREAARRAQAVVAVLLLGGVLIGANYRDFSLVGREHEELRHLLNPTAPVYAVYRHVRGHRSRPETVAPIALDASRVGIVGARRPLLTVLVVGETARAANFSLNGYARRTNPQLERLPVIAFRDVRACGTSTAVSVPCMFSPFGRERYSDRKAKSHETFLDVLERVGVSVLWRDNNSGCKGTCDRVPRETEEDLARAGLCRGDECFDEVLLEGLPDVIGRLAGDGLIVLHTKGSHGPAYHERSPEAFKPFLPECSSNDLTSCAPEAIVNGYDNSIVYTDHVLGRLIALLEGESDRFDVAMLYLSDHGESLGEDGLYLHGLPYWMAPDEQTRVPMLLWLSDGFEAGQGTDRACLERRRDDALSHDNLFHSMLGLFGVRTTLYQPELDLFHPCRGTRHARTAG